MHYFPKKILLIFLACIFLFFTGCKNVYTSTTLNHNPSYSEKELLVHYIDIGQGDSILIQINNKNLLIDSGPGTASSKLFSYLDKYGVRKLDYIIATHPHEDHIGNMGSVIKKYVIGQFYAPKISSSTKTFESMTSALKQKKLKINVAKPGVSLDLGSGINCDIIAPLNTHYDETNHYSAVVKLSFGSKKFLFMGDAEKVNERELLASKVDLNADVLKVGHHGSSSSSSKEFLEAVSPEIAVISCGKGNDYGHPHKETTIELNRRNITLYRTDINKDILLICDGNKITKK